MRSKEFDAYIEGAADFARPILRHLRDLFHSACPTIEEKRKWQHLSFEHKGMMGMVAAFKAHVTFGFWKEKLVKGSGDLPAKITSLKDLPADRAILAMIREAVRLNDEGVKAPKPKKAGKPALAMPDELAAKFALKKHQKEKVAFEGLPPSHRREYLEWILEAKRPETLERRIAKTLENLAQARSLNWKYERKG